MEQLQKPDDVALRRHVIVAPVISAIESGEDASKIAALKKTVCMENSISRRTLGRWLDGYAQNGFAGLKPSSVRVRMRTGIPQEIVDEAILLRREVPSRSVAQIIDILELEGMVEKGSIARTTLQHAFQRKGYSSRQMRLLTQKGVAARRFARKERNEMWQSDIKYGPALTIDGEVKRVYLVTFIDDATRYVIHGEFYASKGADAVEDCFRKAILKEGVPRRVFFDNGKEFRNDWMHRACAMLGIQLIFAAPYSPEAKGKVERFNRTVDSFLAEAALKKPKTVDEYNDLFKVWLTECYHNKEHSGIDATPEYAYKKSNAPLRFPAPELVASAFLHYAKRKADKSGCIDFNGRKYEVGVTYIGKYVDIEYDIADLSVITVKDKDTGKSFAVTPLVIGEHTGPRPKLPERLTAEEPTTSRLLDAKYDVYEKRQLSTKRAISYARINKESQEAEGTEGGGVHV